MDGNKRARVIQTWFESVIKNGGIDRYDDLHVDEIDPQWESQSSWISAASLSFDVAVGIRNNHGENLDLNVLLSIPLESGIKLSGSKFQSREDLEEVLSYTPPSLYLLRSDNKIMREAKATEENRVDRGGHLTLVNGAEIFGMMRESTKCFYSESKRPDEDEYSRYLYLIG